MSGVWLLPKNTVKPEDARIKSGKYVYRSNKINMSSNNFESNIKNLKGTFAVEDMTINESIMINLERLETQESSCLEIVEELKIKYTQRT